jgi:hypothetical protein
MLFFGQVYEIANVNPKHQELLNLIIKKPVIGANVHE